MALTFFYSILSAPSRSMYLYMKFSGVHYEPFPVNLLTDEHLTDRFAQDFNRFQLVPFLHDGSFRLGESIAVLRYIADKYNVDNHWYPKDPVKRAPIDEFLEWQHVNLRAVGGVYLTYSWIEPAKTNTKPDPAKVQPALDNLLKAIEKFETYFLENRQFIASEDEPTIADIFAISEFEQLRVGGFDMEEQAPGLVEWMDRVKAAVGPLYEEVFGTINGLAVKMAKRRAKL